MPRALASSCLILGRATFFRVQRSALIQQHPCHPASCRPKPCRPGAHPKRVRVLKHQRLGGGDDHEIVALQGRGRLECPVSVGAHQPAKLAPAGGWAGLPLEPHQGAGYSCTGVIWYPPNSWARNTCLEGCAQRRVVGGCRHYARALAPGRCHRCRVAHSAAKHPLAIHDVNRNVAHNRDGRRAAAVKCLPVRPEGAVGAAAQGAPPGVGLRSRAQQVADSLPRTWTATNAPAGRQRPRGRPQAGRPCAWPQGPVLQLGCSSTLSDVPESH